MVDFEENVEEMVGTTREAAAVATESSSATTAGDETAATSGVMYTDEGELEFDEDEMAALEGQRLVAEMTVYRKLSPSQMMMKA